jgi:hypothetical protein
VPEQDRDAIRRLRGRNSRLPGAVRTANVNALKRRNSGSAPRTAKIGFFPLATSARRWASTPTTYAAASIVGVLKAGVALRPRSV